MNKCILTTWRVVRITKMTEKAGVGGGEMSLPLSTHSHTVRCVEYSFCIWKWSFSVTKQPSWWIFLFRHWLCITFKWGVGLNSLQDPFQIPSPMCLCRRCSQGLLSGQQPEPPPDAHHWVICGTPWPSRICHYGPWWCWRDSAGDRGWVCLRFLQFYIVCYAHTTSNSKWCMHPHVRSSTIHNS